MNDKVIKILEFNKIKEKLKEYTVASAAKDTIDELKPYDNAYQVKSHLLETKEALILLSKKGTPPFEGVYDVRSSLDIIAKGGSLLSGGLLKIANVLKSARNFKSYITSSEEDNFKILEDITSGITPLKNIEDKIFTAIIAEDEISDKASNTLSNIRKSLKDKNSSIRERVNSLLRNYGSFLQENFYTIRGDRYVLPVKAENKGAVKGLVHDQSASGSTLFIEPMELVNLNNDIKELMLKEKVEIDRILSVLSKELGKEINKVKVNAEIVMELDFIFAKAKYASSLNATMPIVSEKKVIDIIEGRHPLLDQNKVVPLTINLGRDFTSLIITGPNTGGKTVTLKTLGLIELMGLSGLLIPAKENSTIGFYKEIFADIGDEQSIEQSLSTFSSHMTNIVSIIEEADDDSLALFDELGAGTDPTEGAALAISILETLRKRKVNLMSTTHYSELKGYALKTDNVENASVEFDVESLRPTYRLLVGVPGKSNAFEISKRLGLPNFIIDDARGNIQTESLKFEELIESLQKKNIEAQNLKVETENLKTEARKLKEKYENKYANLQGTKEKAAEEGRREAKKILKEAKEEADNILKEMRELERFGGDSSARRKMEERRKTLKDNLEKTEVSLLKQEEEEGTPLKKVREGDEVFIPSLNQKAIVLSEVDNKGEVMVEAGIMKISIKLNKLRAPKVTKEEKKREKREARLNLKRVETSIDIRGVDAEEGKLIVDKYLDDAFVGGLNAVTIIHGKGTGVLRNAINQMLKNHSHVKTFRIGEFNEGGMGATVVGLK